jgi:hypothetical protein
VLTATLSYFLELEAELELLGSGYIADLMSNVMEALWTRTHRASEYYRRGFFRRLLVALLMALERSREASMTASFHFSSYFLFFSCGSWDSN